MPIPMTLAEAKVFSTEANPAYAWSVFLDESTDPVIGSWVDPLTLDMQLLLDTAKDTRAVTLTESMPLTTLSYNLYGHTSMWAIILYLNGYQHPDEIPPGATLQVPSKAAVDTIINKAKLVESNYGKSFRV